MANRIVSSKKARDTLNFLSKIFEDRAEELSAIRGQLFESLIDIHKIQGRNGNQADKFQLEAIQKSMRDIDLIVEIMNRGRKDA